MKKIKLILLGMTCSIVCSIVLILCFSAFLVKNNINEELIPIIVGIFFAISILCGAIVMTRKLQKHGAVYGLLMAITYIIVIYIISSVYIGDFSIQLRSLYLITSGLILGIIGGIIGVNIK